MAGETERPRPPVGVPATAVWDQQQGLWRVGEVDDSGRPVGPQRLFRENGSLASEASYVDGTPDGPFRRFHASGALAREGCFSRGVLTGTMIAHVSEDGDGEPLATCCVPVGARKLVVTQFGGVFRESFFDGAGRKLLPDGSAQPPVPPGLPADATYVPASDTWEHGAPAAPGAVSIWRTWNAAGELLSCCEHKDGKRHGVCLAYAGGRLTSSWTYRAGLREGPGFQRLPPGLYEDARIEETRGEHRGDQPVGVWRYGPVQEHERHGRESWFYEIDRGRGLGGISVEEPSLVAGAGLAAEAAASVLVAVAHAKRAEGEHVGELVALLRRATALDDREAIVSLLRPWPRLTGEASASLLAAAEQGGGDEEVRQLLEALARGAQPAAVFTALASVYAGRPEVGLGLATTAATLAATFSEQGAEALALAASFCIALGRFGEAVLHLGRLAAVDASSAVPLERLLRVTTGAAGFPLDLGPALRELADQRSPELPHEVAQPLAALRAAISKAALRVARVREALVERLGVRGAEVVPDVSSWVEPGTRLESYTFETEDGDRVQVAEEPLLEGLPPGELLLFARTAWVSLVWLSFAAGLERVGLPAELRVPSRFGEALTTAFLRHFRAHDQLQTGGVRARVQGHPDALWEGAALSGLRGRLLRQARDEYLEMRAALYFAADDTCRSVWQDDLRD